MADTKISALPAATTPLAGTEVLPIVQGGVTEKVAVDDLTVKNVRSNATSGILQVTGPAVAATRVMTTPDANFTVARTDAAQSFTGDQTLSTGNLVIGTNGKGIDFSATPGTGTSELLADYEEGTWTPSLGGTATYSQQFGTYTKVGRLVTVRCLLEVSSIGSGSVNTISGLPYTALASPAVRSGGSMSYWAGLASSVVYLSPCVGQGASTIFFIGNTAASSNIIDGVTVFQNNAYIMLTLTYEV
jgi:hypothetical protein